MGVLATPITALANAFDNFVSNVGNFFGNLIDSLGQWFSDVFSGIVNLGSSIGQWFTDLINSIGQWFTDLINSIGQWFTDLINGISELANNISSWFAQVFDTLGEIINYLNPFHEKFFLKLAFIPSEGFISGKFNELKVIIDDKLPIIGTLKDLFNSITVARSNVVSTYNSTPPTFTIKLPSKWGGQTVQVINFEPIDPYIPYIKTLLRFFLWIPFIIKLYKRLPQVIY